MEPMKDLYPIDEQLHMGHDTPMTGTAKWSWTCGVCLEGADGYADYDPAVVAGEAHIRQAHPHTQG